MAEAQNPLLQPLPDGIVPAAAVARTEKHWLLVMAGMLAMMMALAVNPPVGVPRSLNGFALWNAILLVFMIVTYGYPIAQFFVLKSSVPVYEVTRQSSSLGVR